MSSLVLGVTALNAVFLAAGYGVLAPSLRGRTVAVWAS